MSNKKGHTGGILAMTMSIIAVLANISEIIQMFQKNKPEKFENSVVDTFINETITEQSTVQTNNTYSENSYPPYYSEPRYDYNINVTINDKRKYTIVEESSNCDNLKSNADWKNLNDTKNSNSSSGGQSNSFEPYIIKIENPYLQYYSGPGYDYSVNGAITDKSKYTIVEESNGWGKLKSGAGWINLNDSKNSNSLSGGQINSFEPYIIKIENPYLQYYSGPGYDYSVNGAITDKSKYTIVEESNGWGKLKSGAGWINLNDAKNSNSSSGGQSNSFEPYIIKIENPYLQYYLGPGYDYSVNGAITDKNKYTIVEESNGWGKLKSGAGWINLNDAKMSYEGGLADDGIGYEEFEDIQSNSVDVYSCNNFGQINAPNGSINGYSTSYIVNGGAMSCVRTDLMNEWHVTAVNYCTVNGTTWYELYDTDDGDYYGWVDGSYINFF